MDNRPRGAGPPGPLDLSSGRFRSGQSSTAGRSGPPDPAGAAGWRCDTPRLGWLSRA